MIAALYVERGGAYWDQPGIDPWDESRDARKYRGPHSVVAHPPCARWSTLAYVNRARYGLQIGDDSGCFAAALAAVTTYGGVLEHPKNSLAWKRFLLPAATHGRWNRRGNMYATEVSQRNYGHRARKLTWLLYVGNVPPAPLDWSPPPPPLAQISTYKPTADMTVEHMGKKESRATPPAFRDLLLRLATGSRNLPR